MAGQMTDEQSVVEEPGFRVDGRTYPVPPIDTFTFGELSTLYDYTGLTIYDWGRRHTPEGTDRWSEKTAAPAFNMCLVHVAYLRGNPDLPDDTVRALVRDLNWMQVIEGLMGEGDDLGETPGTTSVPEQSSGRKPNENEDSKQGSGTSSPTGSTETPDQPSSPPATTGTGESDTSPTPRPVRLAI